MLENKCALNDICHNSEIYIIFLGLKNEEFVYLKALLTSYLKFYSDLNIPINIIDQSLAIKNELNNPELFNGHPAFRVNERYIIEAPMQELDLQNVQLYFKMLTEQHNLVRVIPLEKRLFHSQCINRILFEFSKSKFVLLLDSDTEFIKDGFFNYISSNFPLSSWELMTAVGALSGLPVEIRNPGLRIKFSNIIKNIKFEMSKGRIKVDWRKMNFPRLQPYILFINRELVRKLGIDFKLMFLELKGKFENELIEFRVMGDCASSLLFFSAYHGLKMGMLDDEEWVRHDWSKSWKDPNGRRRNLYRWFEDFYKVNQW